MIAQTTYFVVRSRYPAKDDSFVTLSNRSAGKPLTKFRANEGFDAVSSSEPPPELAMLTLKANADIKEWAARMLKWRKFSKSVIISAIWRELKLISVRQFLHSQQRSVQALAQLFLPQSLIGRERSTVAEKRTLRLDSRG
jgi:hypothetical protein